MNKDVILKILEDVVDQITTLQFDSVTVEAEDAYEKSYQIVVKGLDKIRGSNGKD